MLRFLGRKALEAIGQEPRRGGGAGFISMDEPEHGPKRKAVSPTLAPFAITGFSGAIVICVSLSPPLKAPQLTKNPHDMATLIVPITRAAGQILIDGPIGESGEDDLRTNQQEL